MNQLALDALTAVAPFLQWLGTENGIIVSSLVAFVFLLWPICYMLESFDLWWNCNVEPKRQEKFRRWHEENMVHIGNNRYVHRNTVTGKEWVAAHEGGPKPPVDLG